MNLEYLLGSGLGTAQAQRRLGQCDGLYRLQQQQQMLAQGSLEYSRGLRPLVCGLSPLEDFILRGSKPKQQDPFENKELKKKLEVKLGLRAEVIKVTNVFEYMKNLSKRKNLWERTYRR